MGGEIEFKAYEQHQGELLPGFVGDALDPADPVFFVDDAVEGMDLAVFERQYSALGEHPFPPRMLLKLWLFAAIAGVYSGREVARRLYWDLRFKYLAGALRPNFRTINRFRSDHREALASVLLQTVELARAAGLARLGRVAIDGTKQKANTSRYKAMSHQRMCEAEAQLKDEIAQILMQIEELNAEEDAQHRDDGDGSGGASRRASAYDERGWDHRGDGPLGLPRRPGEGCPQGLLREDLVVQPIPPSPFWPSTSEGIHHALRPHGAFHPPVRIGFSRQHSPPGHFGRVVHRVMRHARIHLPGVLRSTGFHRLPRYYDASVSCMADSRRR
jgi:transposase